MKSTKTILILGAGGLLGNTIHHNLKKSYDIVGLSHNKNKDKKILKSNYHTFSEKENSYFRKADVIINCIGENSNEDKMKKINIDILRKVALKINTFKKKKKFIHISTCGVYGNLSDQLIDEKTIPKPTTKYSVTKFKGELILKKYLENYTQLIILRPSQVMGKNMKNTSLKKLFYFIKKKLFFFVNNKNSVFSYIFSDDLISVIIKLIKSKNIENKIFNISNEITYKELVKIIQRTLNQNFYFPSVSPFIIKSIIYILDRFQIKKIPINNKTLNSLMAKTTFKSNKIKKDLKIKKFTNINIKNLKTLI